MGSASDLAEAYRKADLRLRLLLFGDGVDTPGLVKGEEPRQRVTLEIRHLRDAFNGLLDVESEGRAKSAEGALAMEEELRSLAAVRSRGDRAGGAPALLTVAEAADRLRVSTSTLYRAIRKGDVQATRPTGGKRGPLRISQAELHRLLGAGRPN
jgi:excisionase family DNA binding protein